MGNICRSPMAESIFKHLVAQEELTGHFYIDSVGTDAYHIGDLAHHGTRRVLADHGIRCDSISRRVTKNDLTQADYVIAMDHYNVSDLQYMAQRWSQNNHIYLLLDFAQNTRVRDVPDPYYTGNFEKVYQLVNDGCKGLLAHIRKEHNV
jgi:protein-tyrosine phosphatase